MIYFSLVYSHLQYAIGAWDSATKTSLHRLNTLHNDIITTISWSSYRYHVTPFFSQLNLLKLEDIHQLQIAKLMHSFHSNRMPNTFDRLFTAVNSIHTHETRNSTSGQYFCHPVCSKYGKKSIKFKGPRIWQQIVCSQRITSKVNICLLSLNYYSICNIIRLSVIACSQLNARVCVYVYICSKLLQHVCICSILFFVCFNI